MRPRVVFLSNVMPHYRVRFHDLVKERLEGDGVEYALVYGAPRGVEAARNDTVDLRWGRKISNLHFGAGSIQLIWQPALSEILRCDLAIIGQENKHVINYVMQSLPLSFRPKIALFGHGRNFQSRFPNSVAERWKSYWAKRADWWFAYTASCRDHIVQLGFDPSKITVFNNAIDTVKLRELLSSVSDCEVRAFLDQHQIMGENIGIFIGGLYSDKRLDVLIDSADRIRERVRDFELLILGAGQLSSYVNHAAERRPWIKYLGPRFGRDKAILIKSSKAFLMPGLVGLAVLDAATAGVPMITTNYPYHSPEIDYLEDGVTGVISRPFNDVYSYAGAVVDVLTNEPFRISLSNGAVESSKKYTIESMANTFSDGVIRALRI